MESWLRGMRVKVPSVRLSRFGVVLLVILIAVMVSGCSNFGGAQNTFSPEGPVANRQRDLFQLVLWPAFAIFVLVEGLCVYMAIRFRQRKGDDTIPRQVHGKTRGLGPSAVAVGGGYAYVGGFVAFEVAVITAAFLRVRAARAPEAKVASAVGPLAPAAR